MLKRAEMMLNVTLPPPHLVDQQISVGPKAVVVCADGVISTRVKVVSATGTCVVVAKAVVTTLAAVIVLVVISIVVVGDGPGETAVDVVGDGPGTSLGFDVVVYDATSGGITAAVSTARKGLKTAIVCASWPSCFVEEGGGRIGGMSSNGLGQTDIGATYPYVSGLAREFYTRNRNHYHNANFVETSSRCRLPSIECNVTWNLEPHVAEEIFQDMIKESGVEVFLGLQVSSVQKTTENRIESITLVDTTQETVELHAQIFIDASYEGDLMALGNISYTLGRECQGCFNESLAGMSAGSKNNQFNVAINPFNDSTGLPLPFATLPFSRKVGSGDDLIQSYNFRLCVTTDETNKVPFPKPNGYNPLDWELLRRYIVACEETRNATCQLGFPSCNVEAIPGKQKNDMNNCGGFSTDCIGCSQMYPEATYEMRKTIWRNHLRYQQGLLYYMANDPSVPHSVRTTMSKFGLCKDEFGDNMIAPHWPPGLYVRAARRLVGYRIFTQNTPGEQSGSGGIGNLSIAIGGYNFDSHNCQRLACANKSTCYGLAPNGTTPSTTFVWDEGDVEIIPGLYQIPYWIMLPKESESTNILVVATPSASHIGMATLRMEPQFMMIGHAAGTAAFVSIRSNVPVQKIDLDELTKLLRKEGMITKIPDT